jgi:hypothetical protein
MKVGWFQGDAQIPDTLDDLTQDQIMAMARHDERAPILRVLLVPDYFDITHLSGDDWNDAPADCNASRPYDPPPGSLWLDIRLGDPWPTEV